MKKLIFSWLLSVLFLSTAYAQYGTARTGYEGDYFSLEGALDLFKQSYTLRDFERKLNTQENWVNNLDLNYDGSIDYIRVEHRRQGNFHAIILQALLDRYDVQDVAVIEIEIIGRREAILQIVGDEDLYGEEVFVEPVEGYADSRRGTHSDYGDFVNVYYWQPVQHILGRQYQVYRSPYRWQYYPTWWRTWAPCTWNVFRPRIVIYQRYYHVVHVHRVIRVHHFYRNYRSYSYGVVQRANRVRVRHGKDPIHRPQPVARTDRRPRDYRRSNGTANQPGATTRPRTARQSPASVSRKRTLPASKPNVSRRSTTRSRTTTSPAPSSRKSSASSRRATPAAKPDVSRKSTTRSRTTTRSNTTYRQPSASTNRSTSAAKPKVSRKSTTRSRATTRSNTTYRRPSASSNRSTPAAKPNVSRKSTTRSRATTRSNTASSRRPAASSRRSAPTSKPKVSRKSTPKRSSSKGSSRSRRGGGN